MDREAKPLEKKMINDDVEKEDSWMPETPAKSKPIRKVTLDDLEVNGVEFDSSSSKKRKNKENGELSKAILKKLYRPKVISQISNITKNKDSIPKQRRQSKRTEVRRDPSWERRLFHENATNNKLGIEYNSLQTYKKAESSSCLFLAEDRPHILSFPLLFKKKRMSRERMRLQKLLTSFKKGRRSKSFIRKRNHCIDFNVEGSKFMNKILLSKIKKIRSLKKNMGKKIKKLVVNKISGELVPYKRSSPIVNVELDEETSRVWNLLKDEKGHEEEDEWKKKYWEDIRKLFKFKAESFINYMNMIQGNRRFLPWKGSVLDSVIGVLLTQNVADYLSSHAYMTLASKFPAEEEQPTSYNVIFPSLEYEKENEENKYEEMEGGKAENSFKVDDNGIANNSSSRAENIDTPGMIYGEKKPTVGKKNTNKEEKEKLMEEKRQYWDTLKKLHTKDHRDRDHMDSVDWEAVRCAEPNEVAEAIKSRGQHNIIGNKIQLLLNTLKESYGNLDLEWLRYAPPKEVKEYLLTIYGLGLKSVECIRLLTLHHNAFPVDINVARIVVRLGWVPLQPLPDSVKIHELDKYPDSNKIQEYLWPRLCTLDPLTLYELHYQLITFGKVLCTKKRPNCNVCPFKNECKHYASSLNSTKLALPESVSNQSTTVTQKLVLPESTFIYEVKKCEPIVEMPASPKPEYTKLDEFKVESDEECYQEDGCGDIEDIMPIVEMPASPSPKPEDTKLDEFEVESDEECCYQEDDCGDIEDIMPTINLSNRESHDYSLKEYEYDTKKSTALVVLNANSTNSSMPKDKNVSRLKTEHPVYVLPDGHPLLAEYIPRDSDDPCPYLLLRWSTVELENSTESTKSNLQEEEDGLTVPGTLLIPCRTAMRGRFPLNATYFQVNEVFADYASMTHPINVPRKWLWNLKQKKVYLGTALTQITKGMTLLQIHDCFWNGFICVRAFDTKTRAPKAISSDLHRSTTAKVAKQNKNAHID